MGDQHLSELCRGAAVEPIFSRLKQIALISDDRVSDGATENVWCYQDDDGRTAFHWAIALKNFDLATKLMGEPYNSPVLTEDSDGITPFMTACMVGADNEFVRALLHESAASVDAFLERKRKDQEAPSLEGRPEEQNEEEKQAHLVPSAVSLRTDVSELSEAVSRAEVINWQDKLGNTPLLYASSRGNLRLIRLLLQYGADLTVQNNRGESALHRAVSRGNLDLVEELVLASEQIHAYDKMGHSRWMNQPNYNGDTALFYASMENNEEVGIYLIQHGCDKEKRNKAGLPSPSPFLQEMRQREARRKRERENLPPALSALMELIPEGSDARVFLQNTFSVDSIDSTRADGDAVIEGEGLDRLLETLGGSCPNGARDILAIARRVPRSQSAEERISVAELCFAVSQVSSPVNVHERRRAAAAESACLDESSPLIQYYRGRRFATVVEGGVGIVPGATGGTLGEASSSELHMEVEWGKFMASIGTPLPMTLRVHRSERMLEQAALDLLDGDPEVKLVVRPVLMMPPHAGVYSCSNSDYHSHRRSEYVCRTLHAASAVSFQEVVSTLPVHVLDIKSHHSVLDMCGAPGSKTLQALDEMLRDGWSHVTHGVLITNEKDRVKATQTLPARLKRYHAPHVMCTCCDGVQWPRLYELIGEQPQPPTVALPTKRFDRIICDVPCSGDGIIRKEPSVATTWSAGYVKSLVPTQMALLRRGLDLLQEGGILVYSTCSMNPKEDEEVVCAGLEMFGGCVELVDVNETLRSKGIHLRSCGGLASPNVGALKGAVLPSSYDGGKVLRVLPHRDDTGGFFVAAFRKVRLQNEYTFTISPQKLNQWTKGKLWAPLTADDANWQNIASFYGFDRLDTGSFQYFDANCRWEAGAKGLVPVYHLNPHGGPVRRIVLVTPALADMVFRTRPYKGPGVEVVSIGVRCFELYDGKYLPQAACRWRAVMECASYLAVRCAHRKMHLRCDAHRELLLELLRGGFVWTREHWFTLLGDAEVCCASEAERYPLVQEGLLVELLDMAKDNTALLDELTTRATELLNSQVRMGGVLIGIVRSEKIGAQPLYLSATLSGSKLELAVDGSLRAFALMAYLDEQDGGDLED